MTATEELRRLLDERGVEWQAPNSCQRDEITQFRVGGDFGGTWWEAYEMSDGTFQMSSEIYDELTPEQAIAATLGPVPWVSPTWERWHKSLRHDEIKSIGDAVEQLMYEVIEFGGDMGPNGNTYNGIDEGDVLTTGFITEWVERFENMLGLVTCRMERIEDEKRILLRCGECVHWREVRMADGTVMHRCSGVMAYVTPDEDGYCKWGRRVTDGRQGD